MRDRNWLQTLESRQGKGGFAMEGGLGADLGLVRTMSMGVGWLCAGTPMQMQSVSTTGGGPGLRSQSPIRERRMKGQQR